MSSRIQVDGLPSVEYTLTTGYVPAPDSDKIVAVAVVHRTPPKTLQVKSRGSIRLELLSSIYYSEPLSSDSYNSEIKLVQKKAIEVLHDAQISLEKFQFY